MHGAWLQGMQAHEIMEQGGMVPTSLVLGGSTFSKPVPCFGKPVPGNHSLVMPFVLTLPTDLLANAMASSGQTRFLVDGFPRKLDQLQEFEEKVTLSLLSWAAISSEHAPKPLHYLPHTCTSSNLSLWLPAADPACRLCAGVHAS